MIQSLLDLVVRVRTLSGRPLDDAGLDQMRQRVLGLSQAEATAQRNTLKRLLEHHAGTTAPNRNRP
ncbi:hypothetical protein [Amnibacterium kyonggiense]|uniref:Uncharacterized protein n=1 Tax=Amnibacterium kyonggiense TaxID=595671 RepID=A0A4R7FMP9_9MICO|nr:hypothetical protein [Amnibacterium kyonggiense]TDS77706.1 hypothetical protein CLV52_2667 [Amnibacterium kyonggiense]